MPNPPVRFFFWGENRVVRCTFPCHVQFSLRPQSAGAGTDPPRSPPSCLTEASQPCWAWAKTAGDESHRQVAHGLQQLSALAGRTLKARGVSPAPAERERCQPPQSPESVPLRNNGGPSGGRRRRIRPEGLHLRHKTSSQPVCASSGPQLPYPPMRATTLPHRVAPARSAVLS